MRLSRRAHVPPASSADDPGVHQSRKPRASSRPADSPIGEALTPDLGRGRAEAANPPAPEGRRGARTVWVSDLHLGTRGSQPAALAAFLKAHPCESLYLVGDIIDGWALRKTWYWDAAHNHLARRILKMAETGTKVRLICGNHDEFLRAWVGLTFGGIEIVDEAEHLTADGRRLLMLHGDRFDAVTRTAPWLAHLGDWAYRVLLVVNRGFNAARRLLGRPYWSLSLFLKQKVKSALAHMDSFERAVVDEARGRGFDGVVCGHIHQAEIRDLDGVTYHNSGDWVESCTALVEDFEGRIRIERWTEGARAHAPRAAAAATLPEVVAAA